MEEKPLSANDIRVLKAMRKIEKQGRMGYRRPESIGAGYKTLENLTERGYILHNRRESGWGQKGFKLTPESRQLVDLMNAEGEK